MKSTTNIVRDKQIVGREGNLKLLLVLLDINLGH